MKLRVPILHFPRLCLTLLAAALSFAPDTLAQKPNVVSTTTMITDLVQRIAGDRVSVAGLMGPGVDPHLYKPTAADVGRLQSAQLIIYNGLMLEGQMSELFDRLAASGKPVHAITKSIPANRILNSGDGAHPDPHVWGDAELWSLCIPEVVQGLSGLDPAGKELYQKNGEAYAAELLQLHQWAKQRTATLPASQRTLITSHDAFNYLGRAYGFEVVGVQGISTTTEAGLADIIQIIDYIKKKSIKAVFVESSVPRTAIERISKDSGAKVGGELFSDALGSPGVKQTLNGETYDEGTYIGMLKHNINTVVEGLK